jgi:hypothetical protein
LIETDDGEPSALKGARSVRRGGWQATDIQQRMRRAPSLLYELNSEENLAFGYANLNNDDFAEWGNIDIGELLENGAVLDREWKPCTFADALKQIAEEMRADSR